jgi:hypothetical protein
LPQAPPAKLISRFKLAGFQRALNLLEPSLPRRPSKAKMTAVANRLPAYLKGAIFFTGLLLLAVMPIPLFSQDTPSQDPPATDAPKQPGVLANSGNAPQPESKRIFGIVPNYRSSPSLNPYVPISWKEKFKIASQDSFDRGTFVLAAAFAGEGQLTDANPSFGQGAAGYGRYLGTAYADFVIGDFMTEGIYPSLLHQDPRYFRKGSGSSWSRLTYSVGQIVLTHNDSGKVAFNYSEILGNATAVAISNSYYADNRDASDAVIKLASQLGVDAASNLLKEFWPDLQRKFSRKH